MTSSLDLDLDSRTALEFDEVLSAVAGFAVTLAGGAAVRALHPVATLAEARERMDRVEEARPVMERNGRFLPGGLPDVGSGVRALRVQGVGLDPKPLQELARVLEVAGEVRRRLRGLSESDFPYLRATAEGLPDLAQTVRPILDGIDSEGALRDEASPALGRIRRSLAQAGERLRKRLEKVLRAPQSESAIRDDFITQRNGRFVVPIRTDSPHRVHGIVHATSSSGATQFVEPLDAVEANNERVRLREEEQAEVQRILADWSERLRARLEDVGDAIRILTRLDTVQARALYANDRNGIAPQLTDDRRLRLEQAVHPVLDAKLRAEGSQAVAMDLALDPADRILVISGPNTGGKTVALKTLGLTSLMAQTGIPVLAVAAEIPVLRQIRADIGDHQSIHADLSTYSAHVTAIGRALREAKPPCLFLFDEIGGGTEPREGGALARAVLESVARPGYTVAVTTHLGELKTWSLTHPSAVPAAMDFDTERLQPTYRLLVGTAGVSAGLEIAQRLGIDAKLIESARAALGKETGEGERYLQRLRALTLEAEQRRDRVVEQESSLEERGRQLESEAQENRLRGERQLERELESHLKRLQERFRKEMEGLQNRKDRDRLQKAVQQSRRRVEAEARRSLSSTRTGGEGPRAGSGELGSDLAVGHPVWVRSLARAGEAVEDRGKQVEVRLGRMKLWVDRTDLATVDTAGSPSTAKAAPSGPRPRTEAGPAYAPDAGPTTELMLVGVRVAEAEERLDKFLDRAVMAGHDQVRIVHGHGTGRLRQAIRAALRTHPQVREWRAGDEREGGDGATLAVLR